MWECFVHPLVTSGTSFSLNLVSALLCFPLILNVIYFLLFLFRKKKVHRERLQGAGQQHLLHDVPEKIGRCVLIPVDVHTVCLGNFKAQVLNSSIRQPIFVWISLFFLLSIGQCLKATMKDCERCWQVWLPLLLSIHHGVNGLGTCCAPSFSKRNRPFRSQFNSPQSFLSFCLMTG